MARRVTWSPAALEDLEAIAEFIERDSPFYARAVVTKITAVVRKLGSFPLSGRVVPEIEDPMIREHFVFSYRIIYFVEEREVMVLAVIHGKRLLLPDDKS